jgi:hypothetical protein
MSPRRIPSLLPRRSASPYSPRGNRRAQSWSPSARGQSSLRMSVPSESQPGPSKSMSNETENIPPPTPQLEVNSESTGTAQGKQVGVAEA